jgi:hypothetical protein
MNFYFKPLKKFITILTTKALSLPPTSAKVIVDVCTSEPV